MVHRFDMQQLQKLMSYDDLFSSENEYMREANSTNITELDTVPLYVLKPDRRILFTAKLRYFALLIDNAVNAYLNSTIDLLETNENESVAKFAIKKTRDTVETQVNNANRRLSQCDPYGNHWNNLVSDKPDYVHARKEKEMTVFYHYVIAQITRCWLELQDRYAYIIGSQLYDVAFFYSSCVKRSSDPVFEIAKTETYDDEAKRFKKIRTDCCFLYDNQEYFAMAVQEFTDKLHTYKLIPDTLDYKVMQYLFSGRSCRYSYTWLGDKHILTHVIKGLCPDKNPIITPWPAGVSKWDVVSRRFVDPKGEPLPNIRQESPRKKSESVVKELVDALAGYL